MTTIAESLPPIPSGISLSELASALGGEARLRSGSGEVIVRDVYQDSRRVSARSLFAARAGGKVDGLSFVDSAVAQGAVAVLTEPEAATEGFLSSCPVPVLTVPDVRAKLFAIAELIHGRPSHRLPIIGITGTNGKTTTALLVERALLAAGMKPGRLGTVGSSFDGVESDSSLTTPEPDDVVRFFAHVAAHGGTHVVMEVSSHALAQGRVDGCRFDVAAFTNLTQDHLDFHGTMEEYEAAKRLLFTKFAPRVSVVNVDNEAGQRFAATTRSSCVLRVGSGGGCDVRPVDVTLDSLGLRGNVFVAGRYHALKTRLVGNHNLENVLLAIGIVEALGIDLDSALTGWFDVAVPGRLERCDDAGDDVLVLVDYAHTPDALERALVATRPLTQGRLHCLFGCGGDRDPGKRPKMGAAVGRGADRIIVTNDNPRTEDPRIIADAIEGGLRATGAKYVVELDRAKAIRDAILSADSGDVILIAGKGHEPYQIVGTVKYPFDDRVEAKRALRERRERTAR
jgi:UDP-N-acetylmuramoyl-L-alanyl-D-glutamate--2,6-diaminopimelate ligase